MGNVLFGCSAKTGDSTQNGESTSSGIVEKVLFEGKANTLNTEYELLDNLSSYKYLYILSASKYRGDNGTISEDAYIDTKIVSVEDLKKYTRIILGYMHMSNEYKSGIFFVDDSKFKLAIKYVDGSSFQDAYICKIVGIK